MPIFDPSIEAVSVDEIEQRSTQVPVSLVNERGELTQLVVHRDIWFRGKSGSLLDPDSGLSVYGLAEDNTEEFLGHCCLGFVGLVCGYTREEMARYGMLGRLVHEFKTRPVHNAMKPFLWWREYSERHID